MAVRFCVHPRRSQPPLQLPSLAILFTNEAIRFRRVLRLEIHRIPFELFADAISDVAEMICYRECARIVEVRAGGLVGFASLDPFRMMTANAWNEWLRSFEILEIFFR